MKHKLIERLLALACAIFLMTTLAVGCGKKDESKPATLTNCTITVQTKGGSPLENVGVSIYTDTGKTELVDFARTNADGVISTKGGFTAGNAYAFLSDVPAGYAAEEYYILN